MRSGVASAESFTSSLLRAKRLQFFQTRVNKLNIADRSCWKKERGSDQVKHISPVRTCWHKRKLQKLPYFSTCVLSVTCTNRKWGVLKIQPPLWHQRWAHGEGETRTPDLSSPWKNPHTSWFHQHNCHGIL